MKSKHMWIMVICCALPLIGFGVAWYLGVPLGALGTTALILLCPIGHIVMMVTMGKKHSEHAGKAGEVEEA